MEKLSLINYDKFKPRLYQELIAATAVKNNTLCILPTGLGKTYVAILVSAFRLERIPNSKILMIAPTRPLVNQHMQTFKKMMNLDESKLIALTGKIHQNDRKAFYESGKIFFATPQIIKNDTDNGILNLSNFSLLIVDECHRSVKKYAYTDVVERYYSSSDYPLILGLTASPGGMQDKIDEVKERLKIESVEVRTEQDIDVKPYVKEVKTEQVYVELPREFESIKMNLEDFYREKMSKLVEAKLLFSLKATKKELLDVQKKLGEMYNESRDYSIAKYLIICSQAIKIEHAIGLLETQGISSLYKYFANMEKNKTSSSKQIFNDNRIVTAFRLIKELYIKGEEHPKMKKLVEIVKKEIEQKKNVKIIVFANFRDTVDKIKKVLQAEGVEAREFIGQTKKSGKGLSQKEQIQIINEFEYELFNVLIATSIGEEGLSIPAVDVVIFYEPIPSEIRTIQRRGRTGRTEAGKVIFLITKNTRDEWYFWSAHRKEKRMKSIIKEMQYKLKSNDKTIKDYVS